MTIRQMTFEEWYKSYNPQLGPLEDDCLEELKSAYEAGLEQGKKIGRNKSYEFSAFD